MATAIICLVQGIQQQQHGGQLSSKVPQWLH
jgi:hypothetical protein